MNLNGIKSEEHSFDDFDENHDNDFYDDDRMDINDGDDSQEGKYKQFFWNKLNNKLMQNYEASLTQIYKSMSPEPEGPNQPKKSWSHSFPCLNTLLKF